MYDTKPLCYTTYMYLLACEKLITGYMSEQLCIPVSRYRMYM